MRHTRWQPLHALEKQLREGRLITSRPRTRSHLTAIRARPDRLALRPPAEVQMLRPCIAVMTPSSVRFFFFFFFDHQWLVLD